MSLNHREVEYKYPAAITLTEFKDFCEGRDPAKSLIISGFDHFLANPKEPGSFYRHRVNTNENQLTFKRKLTADNNTIREERNIDLPLSVTEQQVRDLCAVHGYEYTKSIFKNCFIYNYPYYTLVMYFCYDSNLTELGRFIEIEMKEDYNWRDEQEALDGLLALERLCKAIGTSPDKRIKKSLFEMFGEGDSE
jgi:adenylate cyclase class IV